MNKLSAALLSLALAVPAAAGPHGILWAPGQKPAQAADASASAGLVYYGGPVIEHAKVYAVFWGENVPAETKTKIGGFFANMLDSVYMDWLSEYHTSRKAVDGREGTKQTIGRGTFNGAVTITPINTSAALKDADVQKELVAQIAAGKLAPADANSLYMIYFPKGVSIEIEGARSCSSFCAYHEGFMNGNTPIYYGIMPVCGGFSCGASYDSMTFVSSHEAIEAITDPFPTPGSHPAYPQAWNDANGEEITDLCQSQSARLTSHGVTSLVSGQWKNSIGGCFNGPWQSTEPSARFDALAARKPNTALLAALTSRDLTCWEGN
ncbi:MAG: hypothetical protein HY923_10755 [Elusimicrobia bacterium]|nr:hypothetical protein [Elusimicrobiota bacterium]